MFEQTLLQKVLGGLMLLVVVGLGVLIADWSDIKKRLKKKSGKTLFSTR